MLPSGSELLHAHEREWASATFSGARHSLDLRIPLAAPDSGAPSVLAALPDHEFDLVGEIVADCVVSLGRRETGVEGCWLLCRIELLTIAED